MKTTVLTVLNALVLGSAVALCPLSVGFAQQGSTPSDTSKTEDILHMSDGRVLHGQIISETRTEIVFEFRDDKLKMKTKLTLQKDTIAQIDRDVPMAEGADEIDQKPALGSSPSTTPAPSRPSSSTKPATNNSMGNYGITRITDEVAGVPTLYIVPLRGQIGTDVHSSVYGKIIEDIRAKKPDYVVLTIDCLDTEDTFAAAMGDVKPEEIGLMNMEDHNKLVNLFLRDLAQFKQVAWVHNALGMSSLVSLSWKNVYMRPQARLGGMVNVLMQSGAKGWSDPDIRAKMMAAWMSGAKSFLERGGYSHALGNAMIDPVYQLSVSWKGRTTDWHLNENGEYLVDGSDKFTANFTAKTAEDFCISQGTAESIDDLALLLGCREYRIVEGIGESSIDEYVRNWRGALEQAKSDFDEYLKFREWASGADAEKYLGRARTTLEKVLKAIERYEAVEVRLGMELGLSKHNLQVELERLKEQIIAMRNTGRRSGGGATGGGGGGGRPGRGGGGVGG